MKSIASLFAGVLGVLLVSACGSPPPSNDRLIEAFQEGRTGMWVSGHGTVEQLPSDEVGAVPRQRMVVRISPELTILVRHQLDEALRVPAQRGDEISFQGVYEWNARGGVVSRTFRDDNQPGGGGWVEHQGTRYD